MQVPWRKMATARYEREREGRRRAQGPWNLKTRLCKQWKVTGKCRYGDDCRFAHGAAELRVFEEWDEDEWSDAEPDDEDIPCIPESATRSPLPPTLDDVYQQIQVARAACAHAITQAKPLSADHAGAVLADNPRVPGIRGSRLEADGCAIGTTSTTQTIFSIQVSVFGLKGRVRTTPQHTPRLACVCVKRWRACTHPPSHLRVGVTRSR